MSLLLELTNRLGMKMSVTLGNDDDPLDAARYWAPRGWRAATIPPGGLRLPLIMADTFDWALIGAREDVIDNESGVWCDGLFWKRREMAANAKKKMGPCVKYSRGAKATDDPQAIEGDEGESFKYVTLVTFRGGGSPIRVYERKSEKRGAA